MHLSTLHTRWLLSSAFAALLLTASVSFAQEAKNFAFRGCTELGGSISFQSITPVSDGRTGSATTIFSLAPFIGYFVSDGFELGLNPLGISSISFSGHTATQVMVFVAPSYNFRTESNAYPFVEALIGYTSQSDGSSLSGFSWGGRVGAKIAVTGKGLLNFAIQYVQITMNPSGATDRNGTNQLSLSAGFTVWF